MRSCEIHSAFGYYYFPENLIANIFFFGISIFFQKYYDSLTLLFLSFFSFFRKEKRHSSCFWVFLYCRANTRVLEKTQSDSRIKEKEMWLSFHITALVSKALRMNGEKMSFWFEIKKKMRWSEKSEVFRGECLLFFKVQGKTE